MPGRSPPPAFPLAFVPIGILFHNGSPTGPTAQGGPRLLRWYISLVVYIEYRTLARQAKHCRLVVGGCLRSPEREMASFIFMEVPMNLYRFCTMLLALITFCAVGCSRDPFVQGRKFLEHG